MRFVHDLQKVVLEATGGDDTALLVFARQSTPFRETTIWGIPGTGREVGDPAEVRNFTYQVFFGATAQSAAVARADDEIFLALDPADGLRIFAANEPTSNLHRRPRDQVCGFDISIEIINLAATPLVLTLEMLAQTIDQG